ncbi:MAG TPA: tetratricopeptide repeat protein [Candidatus Polarisedimenticolia bacterium]|nr:tetratricopeptide repeat protein [Candidatus Polarisedimenticolia bacterium]
MGGRFSQLRKTGKRPHTTNGATLIRGIGMVLLGLASLSLPAWPAQQQQGKQKSPAHAQESTSEDSPKYDPLRAEKDVEVGTFYMRKGDMDAAIARFEDAVLYRPKYATARRLLGEAYEKKGDQAMAVKWYKEYLRELPHARDAKKIQKRIEKLSAPEN